MKSKRIIYLEKILRWMAIAVLKKYQPTVIGITGSVGKTSTEEAVFLALSSKYRVRKNEKNYNNEIGIPLTIIGAESGNRSFWKWLKVFIKWLAIIIFPVKYPEILVLEMGVDRPKDMKYLVEFIPLKAGIFTNVSVSHLEFFRSVEHIAKEKGKMIEALPENGFAILNADDERVLKMKDKTKANVITFGFSEQAQIKASHASLAYDERKKLAGINFKLNYQEKIMPVRLPRIIAEHHIYAVLAGVAAGIAFKVNLVDIAKSLKNFSPLPGRMVPIEGIRNSLIIDDTYNASPKSVLAALEVANEILAPRKIAVLGDMLELGSDSKEGHRKIAQKIFEFGFDLFFGVGKEMEIAVHELRSLGYPLENIFYFEDPMLAGKKLKEILKAGDLILIKGSQSMRMEKIVEAVMADPRQAGQLLCRQERYWRKKPFSGA